MSYRDDIRSGRIRREDETVVNEADRLYMSQTSLGQSIVSESTKQTIQVIIEFLLLLALALEFFLV